MYRPLFLLVVIVLSHVQNKFIFSKYSRKGELLEEMKIVDFTLRTGALLVNKTIEGITQGFFRQGTAEADYVVDPEVSIKQIILTLVELTTLYRSREEAGISEHYIGAISFW